MEGPLLNGTGRLCDSHLEGGSLPGASWALFLLVSVFACLASWKPASVTAAVCAVPWLFV